MACFAFRPSPITSAVVNSSNVREESCEISEKDRFVMKMLSSSNMDLFPVRKRVVVLKEQVSVLTVEDTQNDIQTHRHSAAV